MTQHRTTSRRLAGAGLLACSVVLASPTEASAGGTRTFQASDFDDFDKGETEGAAIESSGKVTAGLLPVRADVPGASVFTCTADLKDTKLAYLGTADKASIQRVRVDAGKPGKGTPASPKVEQVVELGGAVVSALAQHPSGDLLAATLPGGKIQRIDAKGKISVFAELTVDQIWQIVAHEGRFLVATGPRGELFSLSQDGKDLKVLLDSDEKDILSIVTIGKDIVVGTAPGAKVLQVGDPVKGILLHDFPGDEVRSLAVTDTGLVAAVNKFSDRSISSLQALTKQLGRTSLVGQPSEGSLDLGGSVPQSSADVMFVPLAAGKGLDLHRAGEMSWETLLHRDKQYFTSVVPGPGKGEVLVASSQQGKVYRVRGHRDVAVVASLEERQATALCPLRSGVVLATAGGGAAVYRLAAAPATKPRYRSQIWDASQPATYGAVYLRGSGNLTLRARSGPGDEPDSRWSEWKVVALTRTTEGLRGALNLPTRRYMQFEVGLEPTSELRDATVYYAPENLAPLVESVQISRPDFDNDTEGEPDTKLTIKWKAEARDDDDLVYEVRIRPEGAAREPWIKLGGDTLVTKKELKWDLSSVPDGIYEAQVRASDEPSNGSERARSDEVISAPFTIDHKRPVIDDVKIQGDKVSARARDDGGLIHSITFSIDNGPFRAASPSDGLLDSNTEAFELTLPADLKPGKHRLVLRARDTYGNLTSLAVLVER